MIALFLMLYSAVALIQDRRLFTSAPKDVQAKIQDHEERFKCQKLLGWKLMGIAILMYVFAFFYAGYDGVKNGFAFKDFFIRYLVMLYLMKAYDMIFFDWYLLTQSHFFQHYYPETEGCEGYQRYGFNLREQITKLLLFPFVAALLAWICTMFV